MAGIGSSELFPFLLLVWHSIADFEQASRIAIQNRSYSGKFLQNVIINLYVAKSQSESEKRINPQPTNHKNMRGNS